MNKIFSNSDVFLCFCTFVVVSNHTMLQQFSRYKSVWSTKSPVFHRDGNCYVIWRFKEWGQLKKHPECVHTMYKSYQFQWSRPWPLWWLDLIRPPSWNAQFLQNSNYLPQRKIHLAWIITWNDLDSGLSQQQFYSASTTCPRNFMAHLRHLAQQHLHGSKEGSHKLNSQIRQTFELIVILTCDCDRESELQSFLFPGLIVLFNKK